ncbi:hypothetical protein DL767_010444 [Monosporascus sp. MG133]|nr:hypothetical protein DL767_010444 [Monosporascus sp. MG133]
MRDGLKKIGSAVLLVGSAIFLVVGIARKEMRTAGIAKIQLELPDLMRRKLLDLSDVTQLPDITRIADIPPLPKITELPDAGLPDIPTEVDNVVSNIATRVSEGISQVTGAFGSVLDNVPEEITIGTDQICYTAKYNQTDCPGILSDLSTWFPSPLNSFLDLTSIASPISAVLKIKVPTNMDSMIDDLIHRLENMGNAEDLSKLHSLEAESSYLQQERRVTKERLSSVKSLFKEITKILHILSSVSKVFDGKTKKAENTWTSYWGIVQQYDDANFEMESVVS